MNYRGDFLEQVFRILTVFFCCLVFSKKFNIMTALFAHQSPTLPQKIDSREGLF